MALRSRPAAHARSARCSHRHPRTTGSISGPGPSHCKAHGKVLRIMGSLEAILLVISRSTALWLWAARQAQT
jgi:hypothetical protein